jgi:hypothetical protein
MDCDVAAHLGSMSAGANLEQPSVSPCAVTLKLFVFSHGPWPVTFFVRSVGCFVRSRFHGFRYAPGVHHVIVLPNWNKRKMFLCLALHPGGAPEPTKGRTPSWGFSFSGGTRRIGFSFRLLPPPRMQLQVWSPRESNP